MADEIREKIVLEIQAEAKQAKAELESMNDSIKRLVKTIQKQQKENKLTLKTIREKKAADASVARGMKDTYRTYLPLIFASQQIAQSTKSILQPTYDLLGVQDAWNTFMSVAFLPTGEEALDSIINMGEAIMDLPEPVRHAMGDQIVWAQVMGEGTQIGSEMAVMLGGLAGEAVGFAGAATGAGLASAVLDNKTLGALASVNGLGNTLIVAGVSAANAAINLGATSSEADKLADKKLLLIVTTDRSKFDTFKTDVDNFVANPKDLTFQIKMGGGFASLLASFVGKVPGLGVAEIVSKIIKAMLTGSYQEGGVVPNTGLAMVHKGETIIPAGQTLNNYSPSISVRANISGDMDVRDLAKKLNQYMYEEYRRLSLRPS